MGNVKKFLIGLLCTAFLLCMLMAFKGFMPVYAETNRYFSAEEYTKSDNLLNENGTLSEDETIYTFADEVHNAEMAAFIPDLPRVVPLNYLENNGTYSYFGQEYGFYMVVENPYIDLLLVDINYELGDGEIYTEENRENVYTIKIKPILQQSFYITKDGNGNLTWQKYSTVNRPVYYIMNPRFVTSISNENALNQGDPYYSKQEDEGIIIQQTMVEYQRILQSRTVGLEIIPGFLASMALDAVIDTLDSAIFGGFLGFMQSAIDFAAGHCDSRQNNNFNTGETISIFTEQAKETQKEDNDREGYSRTTYFYPEEEIFLSEFEESYAEFSVLVSNTDYKTRLTQICEFDIGKSIGHYGKPFFFEGNWNDSEGTSFFFTNTRVLFDDEKPDFKIEEQNVEGDNIPVYLLPDGKQVIEFEPEYSAYYKFDLKNSDGLNLSVIDSAGSTVKDNGYYDLKDGEKYNIIVTSGDEKVITSLGVRLADDKSSGAVYAQERRLVKLNINQSDVYNLSTNNSYCFIDDILVKTSRGLKSYSEYSGYIPYSTVSVPLQEGEYYVLVYNSSAVNRSFNFGTEECAVGELGETNTVNTDGINYVYIKFEIDTGDYIGTILNAENYKVLDYSLEVLQISRISDGNFLVENNGNVLYIGVLADKGSTNVLLNLSENSTVWKINGEVVDNNNTNLERGNSYEIEFYINGIEQDDTFIIDFNDKPDELAKAIEFSGDILTIKDYCPTNYSFTVKYYFNSLAESISGLVITPVYTVTFAGIESVTNDDELTFNWIQSENLETIYYKVSNDTISLVETIDTSGYIVGNAYSEDLTQYLSIFGISNVTVTIDKIAVATSNGDMAVNLETPFTAKVHMAYESGNGTKSDPYIISCNRHFENLNLTTQYVKYYFSMTKTLSFSSPAVKNFYGYINYSDKETDATYNGPMGSINYNCYVEDGSLIENNYGTIMNLEVRTKILDFDRISVYTVGGIVENNKSTGVISHCGVSLTCSSTDVSSSHIGGIAGINNGKIEHCHVNSQITTIGDYGSIAYENEGIIDDCGVSGKITQKIIKTTIYMNTYVGGMAAKNSGTIKNCAAGNDFDAWLSLYIVVDYVDDDSIHPYAGPIVGENTGTVFNCSNEYFYISTGNLHSWWAWFITYDQLKNINNVV